MFGSPAPTQPASLVTAGRRARRGARLLATLVLASGALVGSVESAGAQTTITFDGISGDDDGSGVVSVANCYQEGGLVFTVVGEPCGMPMMGMPPVLASYTANNGSYLGNGALFNNLGTQLRLTGAGGARFSLFSLDLAPIFLSPGDSRLQPVTFMGMRVGGMSVTQTFDLSLGAVDRQPVTLNGFTNLTSATIDFGAPDFAAQIDNVAASVVPEPSTYALMVTGLAGLAITARRRRAPR